LAGDQNTKSLLASAYDSAVPIVAGQINQVNLTLTYVISNSVNSAAAGSADFKFTYTDSDTMGTTTVAADGFEIATIEVTNPGTGYVAGDLLTTEVNQTFPDTSDLTTVYIKVLELDDQPLGTIKKAVIVQGGRWSDNPATSGFTTTSVISVSGSGAQFKFTFKKAVDIPAGVPWLTYLPGSSGARTKDLKFEITTKGLAPLIRAGGGTSSFKLGKAQLQLVPLSDGERYTYAPFAKIVDATPTYASSFTVPTADVKSDTITLKYTLGFNGLPTLFSHSTYGMLYYILDYYPFGDKGNKWTIRNGIDTSEPDQGEITRGSGVLVKIGNPGIFVPSKVPVQMDTP
jgi:hypothetical protein